jgi:hypothetical protein
MKVRFQGDATGYIRPCRPAKPARAWCRATTPAEAGVFILRMADNAHYLATVRPMQLRDKITSAGVDHRLPVINFGKSKGRSFDHVVILPTEPMRRRLSNPATDLKAQSRAKFCVALTSGLRSVAVAMDWRTAPLPAGFSLYKRAAPALRRPRSRNRTLRGFARRWSWRARHPHNLASRTGLQ